MFRRLLAVVALAAVLLVPAQAFAAAPVATGDLDVQSWPGAEAGQSVVILSLVLPDAAPLPATVRIPVPEGVELEWVGEIKGADPSQDPTRTYTIAEGEGGKYVEYEVSTSRIAQIEGTGPALSIANVQTTFALRFTQTVPSDIVSFSVRLPTGMEAVSMSPEAVADPERNDVGESLYTLPPLEMNPGDTQDIKVVYAPGTGGSASRTGSPAPIVVVLAAGIVVAIIALMYSVRRQAGVAESEPAPTAGPEPDEDIEQELDDDEPFPLD